MNTNNYCAVDPGNPVAVDQGPRRLPQNWQSIYDGQWYYNLTNEALWDDAALAGIGWFRYTLNDTPPTEYLEYYSVSQSPFVIDAGAGTVTQDMVYTQWTVDQIQTVKLDEINNAPRQYSANELAIDSLLEYTIADDNAWTNQQGAALSRLTVEGTWEDVAAFDTTKPAVLALPNNYVGRSYVNRGIELTAENDAAVAAGLVAPYDQTVVSDFITANTIAAEDTSGTQPPTEPTFEIRQAVAVVSEGASELWIYRAAREDANPALRTTYRMALTQKQDDRPLYVFSYTGEAPGTYLTWREFVDDGTGIWRCEATPAEWQYVPGDMSFIFSYGTNPAVQADFFTNPVDFPAGVDEMVMRIRWDVV